MNSFFIKLISFQLVWVHGVPKTGFLVALDDASANFEFYISESIHCKNALLVLIGLDIRECPLMH